MEIKDYLHFYIGQQAQTPTRKYHDSGGKSFKAIGTIMDIDMVINQAGIHFEGEAKEDLVNYPFEELKPILRKLSDMTEEEGVEIFGNEYGGDSPNVNEIIERSKPYEIHFSSTQFKLLLSKGFDLFGLIPAGLAIDKTSLKN